MGKEDSILEKEGKVTKALSNATFQVKLLDSTIEHEVIAHLSGKMRINRIRVEVDDLVTLQISVYALNKGRIISRKRISKPNTAKLPMK